jgi:hypothetical protein
MRAINLSHTVLFAVITGLLIGFLPPAGNAASKRQPSGQQPSAPERQNFEGKMLATPLPGRGCFVAHYGDPKWQPIKCHPGPKTPNPLARGAKPFYVGAGTDYFSHPSGLISSATGSFDAVTNVTAESGPTYYSPTIAHTNVYSLQMNANTFTTTACNGSANCSGWEQFIYSQTQCNGACIFIEYWLLNHTSPCPPNQGWYYYAGTPTTVPGCYLNTAFAAVPVQSLSDLGGLRLSGKVASNTDTVSLSVANGDVYAASNASIAGLGQGWTGIEYNLVGDCCALGAYFTSGPATIKVKVSTVNGVQTAPVCSTSGSGATAETNNLDLVGSCSATGGAQPAISFTESGGGDLPPGITQGDTHLITIGGVHYDFQETGEYILAQAGTDLIVQSRQAFLGASHVVSWNVGLAVQMGKDLIILYPASSLVINLAPTQLADGGSITLDAGVIVNRHGNLFTISRPEGDIVQANELGDHIDATVQLSPAEASQAKGLLISRNGALTANGGALLHGYLSSESFHDYAQTWRVDPAQSLFLAEGRPEPSGPIKPTAADMPSKAAQDTARKVCIQAGVNNAILLKDCILDVAVTGNDALAESYVYSPRFKKDLTLR